MYCFNYLDLTVVVLTSLSYYKQSRGNLGLFPGALCLLQLCFCKNLGLFLGALCLLRLCFYSCYYTD
jgi:hypothetical protein